ncbi:MAG: hypothetical protein NWQ46_11455 [Spirosomaceae bacterium]|nr:hypothetical protein [Spirosomataceae bacterium]
MIKCGIYMYPPSALDLNGKLRLLYECNPMTFLAKQADGGESNGYDSILDIEPTVLHQRVPFLRKVKIWSINWKASSLNV